MLFDKHTEAEIRNYSKHTFETLEYWLKQVIEASMTRKFGAEYLDAKDEGGNFILNKNTRKNIKERINKEKDRFKRTIDAAYFKDIVYIICHNILYDVMFKDYFESCFPSGKVALRNVLNKLKVSRDKLSHANPISHRQAEQLICYSHDLIDSIKNFYSKQKNLHMEFNVPRIIKFKDSFGNEVYFKKTDKKAIVDYRNKKEFYLRPRETLKLEIEIDSSFSDNEFTCVWRSTKKIPEFGNTKMISLLIEEHHVAETLNIQCVVTSNKSWHRMEQGYDDFLLSYYKVLPNI